MVHIVIAGKPVPKGRPKFARQGNFVATYTPEKTANYEGLIASRAQDAMGNNPPMLGALRMQVQVYLPLLKSFSKKTAQAAIEERHFPVTRPDADNYLKCAMDALNGIVYLDAAQIIDARIFKMYGERTRLEIFITEAI